MINYRLLFLCFLLLFINSAKAQERLIDDGSVLKIEGDVITLETGTPVKALPAENAPQAPAAQVQPVRIMRLSGSGSYYLEEIESRVKRYLPAAEQGDPQAQRTLGGIYLSSEAPEKGVEWYRKAAEQKDTVAMLELGNCYQRGRGVGKDVNEAIIWYFDAIKHGNSQGYIVESEKAVLSWSHNFSPPSVAPFLNKIIQKPTNRATTMQKFPQRTGKCPLAQQTQ